MNFGDSAARIISRLYATFGVPMTFRSPLTNLPVTVTAIDRIAGIETKDQKIHTETIKPSATIRVAEFLTLGIAIEDMEDVIVTFNGKSWRVMSSLPKPSPAGDTSSEVNLMMIEADDR